MQSPSSEPLPVPGFNQSLCQPLRRAFLESIKPPKQAYSFPQENLQNLQQQRSPPAVTRFSKRPANHLSDNGSWRNLHIPTPRIFSCPSTSPVQAFQGSQSASTGIWYGARMPRRVYSLCWPTVICAQVQVLHMGGCTSPHF